MTSKRSKIARITIIVGGVLVLITLSVFGRTVYLYRTGKLTISHNYAAEIDEIRYGPEAKMGKSEDWAWPELKRLLFEFATVENGFAQEGLQFPSKDLSSPASIKARAYLNEHPDVMQRVRLAAGKSILGFFYSGLEDEKNPESFGGFNQANPDLVTASKRYQYVTAMRRAFLWTQFDAKCALAEHDSARAAADLQASAGFVRLLSPDGLPLEQLTRYSVAGGASWVLSEALARDPDVFSERELGDILDAFLKALGTDQIHVRLKAYRCEMLDFAQRTFTDDGNGGGFKCASQAPTLGESLASPTILWRFGSRRDLISTYDEIGTLIFNECDKPLWLQADGVSPSQLQIDTFIAAKKQNACKIAASFWMYVDKQFRIAEQATQERDATYVVIALHQYRLVHHEFPGSLDKLVPEYLPAVPLDRLDGKPLKYVLRDGKPILYSIGADGKDDGGILMRRTDGTMVPFCLDRTNPVLGDWILFPPPELLDIPADVGHN